MNRIRAGLAVALLSALLVCLGGAHPAESQERSLAVSPAITPCNQLLTLRHLSDHLVTSTNPRSGRTVEYLVVGDGAVSNQLIVFFNGTSQILPDWPIQMITNVAQSPLIASTAAFNPAEDVPASLCHSYRLVFFDYPGVGLSPDAANYSEAQVVDDADAMLANLGQTYGISTGDVSVVGWSLGTEIAAKFALLDPFSTPARTIHNVVLIATKPGGGLSAQTNGNGAQCVQATFSALQDPTISPALRLQLETNNFKLLFPYQGETPYDGPSSPCQVTINTTAGTATLNVTPANCSAGTQCEKIAVDWIANRLVTPWSLTKGVPPNIFNLQREQAFDLDYGYCPRGGPNFTQPGCSSSQPVEQSLQNGGVCQTQSPPGLPNQPVTFGCVPLPITGAITVINAPEDLYIQHVYGNALITGYQQQFGATSANIDTYPGADGGGHGILLEHPGWTQTQISQALQIVNINFPPLGPPMRQLAPPLSPVRCDPAASAPGATCSPAGPVRPQATPTPIGSGSQTITPGERATGP